MGSLRSYFWELLEILLVGALAVGLVASISLPRLPPLYIARTHLDDAVIQTSKGLSHNVSEVRFGIWGMCYYSENERTCQLTHNVTIRQGKNVAVVDWVKFYYALLAQLIATALSFVPIALRFYFIHAYRIKAPLCHTLFSVKSRTFLSNEMYTIARMVAMLAQTESFICNILLYYRIKSNFHKLGATELTGIGFVLTTVSFGYILYFNLYMWHSAIIWFLSSCCRKKRGEVDHDVENSKDNLKAADSDAAGLTQD